MVEEGRCSICGKKGYFYDTYLKQSLCKAHFEKMIVRRIKRALINEFKATRFKFNLIDDNSIGFKVNKIIFGNATSNDHKPELTLENNLLDDFSLQVIRFFIGMGSPDIKVRYDSKFNSLYSLSLSEAIAFIKIHEPNFNFDVSSKNDILDMIYKLESRRPGAMLSIVSIGRRLGII